MSRVKKSVNSENKESFFEKMKNDKKYNAKVQLIGYGVFIMILVLWLNISSIGSDNLGSSNVIGNGTLGDNSNVDSSLLDSLVDNYLYDITIDISKNKIDEDTNEEIVNVNSIRYSGKSYGNEIEIQKMVSDVSSLYYKVDNNYYSKIDGVTNFVKEELVYDVVDGKYIEIDSILKLINKASLDHVTNYSSGKRESVYHLKVKDVIVSYQDVDVIEIKVLEENDILSISIDYYNLFKVIDKDITECILKAEITNIGKVEDFEVVVNNEEKNLEE